MTNLTSFLLLKSKLESVSPDELKVAVPLLLDEIDILNDALRTGLESIKRIKEIIVEVVDEDKDYKRDES